MIERAILLETTDKIGLSSIVIESEGEPTGTGPGLAAARPRLLAGEGRTRVDRPGLHETDWQKTQAAALLGITRATLYAKVKQYNIQKEPARINLPSGNPPVPPPQVICRMPVGASEARSRSCTSVTPPLSSTVVPLCQKIRRLV